MTGIPSRWLSIALAVAIAPMPVLAQDGDHSGHAGHHAESAESRIDDVSGAEDVLKAYRAALEARDAQAMAGLFAISSAVFENGKAEDRRAIGTPLAG